MYHMKYRRPIVLLIAVGISILLMGWMAKTPQAMMESGSTLKSLRTDKRTLYPEMAIKNGYYVGYEESALRGGVGNYVDRPSGKEREQLALYKDVATFASFYRDEAGMLQIQMNKGILFESDSAQLSGTAKNRLDRVASLMRMENIESAEIYGHADSVGSEGYNERLSERRAGAVRDYLGSQLAGREFASYGEGESDPVAPNTTESGRSRNRRTEIILSE